MASTSTLSLYSNPKVSLCEHRRRKHALRGKSLSSSGSPRGLFSTTLYINRTRGGECFAIRAAAASSSGRPPRASRRVYTESQAPPPVVVAAKEIASFIVPAGTFVIVTFGIALAFC